MHTFGCLLAPLSVKTAEVYSFSRYISCEQISSVYLLRLHKYAVLRRSSSYDIFISPLDQGNIYTHAVTQLQLFDYKPTLYICTYTEVGANIQH